MTLILPLFISLFTNSLWASPYPSDYCHARVFLFEEGPVLVANIASPCSSSRLVVGYKNHGELQNANALTAVIIPQCHSFTSDDILEMPATTYEVGREWHGKGYLSYPLEIRCPLTAYISGVKLAFTDKQGHWDSRYGQNYFFDYKKQTQESFKAEASIDNGRLTYSVWDFLLSRM